MSSIFKTLTVELNTSDADIQTARLTVLDRREVFHVERSSSETEALKTGTQTSKQQVGTLSAIVDEVRQAPVTDATSIAVRRLLLLLGRRRRRWRNWKR